VSVIGITGGISTGKTSFCDCLREIIPTAKIFNADQAAHELTERDPEVKELLRQEFGAEIFSASGDLNRAMLRAIIFTDTAKKIALEQILHARIRRQWSTAAEISRKSGDLFLADIPLLYETGGETLCDRVVVVACSQEMQLKRLVSRGVLERSDAEKMINSQMPLTEKIARADHVVWNNGPRSALSAQAKILASSWRN
jgi:dephospho-CoA kinase